MNPYKRIFSWYILAIFLIAFLITPACTPENVIEEPAVRTEPPASPELPAEAPLEPIIAENAKVLEAETLAALASISEDKATFTFSQSTPFLEALAPGDVIAGRSPDLAPHGFLRQVTAISKNGDGWAVETTQATLEDAIIQGDIEASQTLTPENLKNTTEARGIQLKTIPQETELGVFQLTVDRVLSDEDGDLETTDDQVKAIGNVSFTPSYTFKANIRRAQLQHLTFIYTTTETIKLDITSEVEVADTHKKVTLATYEFQSFKIMAGTFPIWITPVLKVEAGVDGSITVGMHASAAQTTVRAAGACYQQGEWQPIHYLDKDFQFVPPSASINGYARVYAGPHLDLLIYGSVGPTCTLHGYLALDSDVMRTPWWELYGGLTAKAGVKVKVLSHVVASYAVTLFDKRWTIAQAEVPPPEGTPKVQRLAFSSDRDGNDELYLMNSDGTDVQRLTGDPSNDIHPVWAPDGNYLAFASDRSGLHQIYIMDLTEVTTAALIKMPDACFTPAWAPDGEHIAFISGENELYIFNTGDSELQRITNRAEQGECHMPAWAPQGDRLIVSCGEDQDNKLYTVDLDGSAWESLTQPPHHNKQWPAWAPDGQTIAFESYRDGDWEIYTIKMDGSDLQQLTDNEFEDRDPTWAPDGERLAFVSHRDGNYEIYTMNSDGSQQTNLSQHPADERYPAWAPSP